MRVVIWLSRTVGKGFAMKTVVLAGAAAGAIVSGLSYKVGQWRERLRQEKEAKEKEENDNRRSGITG